MNDKSKITMIYVVVALVSALLLAVAFYIRGKRVMPPVEPVISAASQFNLKKDLQLINQDGEQVKISDLKGKVWAFAQFYAACPMCAKRNDQGLKAIYAKFKDHPDFKMVCITINPSEDGVEQMKTYAEALNADTSKWWFLTGEPEPLLDYMVSEMKYDPIQTREDPKEAAEKGALMHNMAISVFDRDLGYVGRRDLSYARAEGEAVYEETEKVLHQIIDKVLSNP